MSWLAPLVCCFVLVIACQPEERSAVSSQDSERLHVQITVPEKIRSIASGGRESHVSYNIVIEGKTYTVNLMRTTFLPHNFRVYGYNGTGIMRPLQQQFQ
ncbi:PREDICTED: disintegrin and metalloproteinase domain-containing protein 2-like, partial [Galeopterus variegatus]|uniref:Disintegrin and metalloproteinase domain-containing protein 2-like n=1 Tax=Galeopterus variegatus TaxID=482537 RepID=A0ABM0SEW1_GALVR